MGDLLAVERDEAALVWPAQAQGLPVEHRADINPLALLGDGCSPFRARPRRQRRLSMLTMFAALGDSGEERDCASASRTGVPTQQGDGCAAQGWFLWASPAHHYHKIALFGFGCSAARQGEAVAPWLAPPDPTATATTSTSVAQGWGVCSRRHPGPPPDRGQAVIACFLKPLTQQRKVHF
ncbi:hypothetical protein BSZ21_01530 [Bradyrhizobium canariense]|uniref:hypothetical protein n=1 Tax=Bradyrhizobium canariense TaxID=255045 RepID=UPI000A198894|nr:hypothetical protein [Bradyrhizobium canariense]OSI79310.1 hypothetical protein BSZ21_01530 [Bradyrhizobium canariense]